MTLFNSGTFNPDFNPTVISDDELSAARQMVETRINLILSVGGIDVEQRLTEARQVRNRIEDEMLRRDNNDNDPNVPKVYEVVVPVVVEITHDSEDRIYASSAPVTSVGYPGFRTEAAEAQGVYDMQEEYWIDSDDQEDIAAMAWSTVRRFFDADSEAKRAMDSGLRALNGEDEPLDAEVISCIAMGDHLRSCDDDGYCNWCGHQESMPTGMDEG